MIYLGQCQDLEVMRLVGVGAFLGDETGEVLLPYKYVPTGLGVGDSVRVFVHTDSDDRLVAITRMPSATLGNIAVMQVVDQTPHGVFVDWGLEKDLFVPEIEQHHSMRIGSRYVVEVRCDERTDRLIGSTRLGRFFDPLIEYLRPGREVELLVWSFNDVGAQVVVDGRHSGLVYSHQVPRNLNVGDALQGYVERLREDGKIDISLRKLGMAAGLDAQAMVLEALRTGGDGFLPLHDKSSPADIAQHFDLSKRVFKAAIGSLFKRELIELERDGIRLRSGT
ncbi:MAG: putative RNA-binding protein (virulence factor B family) [Planctomycetota bacterium]|jgi:predicted RNA-binding protein (virulence factor B family)